jgi:hypothetical protein
MITHMVVDGPTASQLDISTYWSAAVADASLAVADVVLLPRPGAASGDGRSGICWLRDTTIDAAEDIAALGDDLPRANGPDCRHRWRVAVWSGRSAVGIAATMRHELEHCRQMSVHGAPLSDLHVASYDLLCTGVGGMDGGARLYNCVPMEADANSAASVFVRSFFGHDRIDSLLAAGDNDSAMFRGLTGPAPIESLLDRMTAFIEVDGPSLIAAFKAEAAE